MKTSHGIAIDGFMGAGADSGAGSLKKSYKISDASNLLSPKAAGMRLKTAAQSVHQRAQHSQTLMRSAVHRPVRDNAVKKSAIAKAESIKQSSKTNQTKTRTALIDRQRVFRSRQVDKNAKVQRFGQVADDSTKKQTVTTIQKPAPKVSAASAKSSAIALYKPLPSMLTSASSNKLERMLDEALLKADAHKKALNGRLNPNLWQKIKFAPRWLSIGVSVFAIVLLGGYLAIQKVPQVAMRVAATKAHVNAHVPDYTPSGFSLADGIQSSPGAVTIKFNANDNSSRTFTLTQTNSNMDNQALATSIVPRDSQVQTSTIDGTTVYIYGASNNAAWVNHGTQYQINDSANLNSDQLLKIASSL